MNFNGLFKRLEGNKGYDEMLKLVLEWHCEAWKWWERWMCLKTMTSEWKLQFALQICFTYLFDSTQGSIYTSGVDWD